jgi:hypothetical protein
MLLRDHIKEDEIGRVYSMHQANEKIYKTKVLKKEGH